MSDCLYCGRSFTTINKQKQYCGSKCRRAAEYSRNKETYCTQGRRYKYWETTQRKKYQKQYYKHYYRTRQEMIQQRISARRQYNLKLINRYACLVGCISCGLKIKCGSVYEFHHPDPSTKKFTIKHCVGHSLQKLKDEIRKCVVLCANCHRLLHAGFINLSFSNRKS